MATKDVLHFSSTFQYFLTLFMLFPTVRPALAEEENGNHR